MCGIAGVWGADDPAIVHEMLERMAHRGPDAEGMVAVADGTGTLGHRRLSIVDVAGGDQPLAAGAHTLVANGEVYNAPMLRRTLEDDCTFATRSDSEVILHLLATSGPVATSRLSGMFAFAAVADDELLLGRDPIGIKPLYVGSLDDLLVFSSEMRGFPAGTTDITGLAPGTIWSSQTGPHRFYEVPDFPPAARFAGTEPIDHAHRVRLALDAAVQRHLMSDVPVGAFLSGGLDSSAIVALLRPHVVDLHTFAVGLAGSADLKAARTVAEHLGTIHHEYELDPDEIVETMPEIVAALESFDQDLVRSAVPTWFTSRLAAEHVKVVLTGEGADELFAGYRYHKDLGSDAAVQADARRSLAELHHVNLQRVDRITMAHSLEARVPFLDVDLIDTALSIPAALRRPRNGGLEKEVLRYAVADLLPDEIVWRDKAQFDEGSGTAELLPTLSRRLGELDADRYQASFPESSLRSVEECHYHALLRSSLDDPDPILATVARWADR